MESTTGSGEGKKIGKREVLGEEGESGGEYLHAESLPKIQVGRHPLKGDRKSKLLGREAF